METSEYKLELARIKANKQVELKRLGSTKSRYSKILQPIQPAPLISKEQDMLQDLFGGRGENRVMFGGNGECATKVDGALMPNNFGNEIEDGEQTSDHFGFGSRHETGGFFGI